MDIAEIVRQQMEREGITAYRLAQLTGITQQTILNFTQHGRAMNSTSLAKVLDALGMTIRPARETRR